MVTDVDQVILEKFSQFQGLVTSAVSRFSVPGRIDLDDISTDAMLLIHTLMQQYPNSSSTEFTALFRRSLHNKLISQVRYHTAQCRDYAREMSGSAVEEGGSDVFYSLEVQDRSDFWWLDVGVDPADACQLAEQMEAVEQRLDPTTRVLWDLLVEQPPTLKDSLREYNYWNYGKDTSSITWRVISFHLQKQDFSWDYRKVHRHLQRLRKVVIEVFGCWSYAGDES
jgi:DNA-directed RNA polymerase specialized sigma24 family protein